LILYRILPALSSLQNSLYSFIPVFFSVISCSQTIVQCY
jgi:hypothetical protein